MCSSSSSETTTVQLIPRSIFYPEFQINENMSTAFSFLTILIEFFFIIICNLHVEYCVVCTVSEDKNVGRQVRIEECNRFEVV